MRSKSTCNSQEDFPINANWTRCYNPNGKMWAGYVDYLVHLVHFPYWIISPFLDLCPSMFEN